MASGKPDPHLCDFLETHFLNEQVEAIKDLSDLISKMKRAGPGLGENIVDKEISVE
jgi:ferritin heavy chain